MNNISFGERKEGLTDIEIYELGYYDDIQPKKKKRYYKDGVEIECHSGIIMIHNRDFSYKRISRATRIEESWDILVKLASEGRFWNIKEQEAWDAEGGLSYTVLEYCPPSILVYAKRKWCKVYKQSMQKNKEPFKKKGVK